MVAHTGFRRFFRFQFSAEFLVNARAATHFERVSPSLTGDRRELRIRMTEGSESGGRT
jgi:hypothetical protein